MMLLADRRRKRGGVPVSVPVVPGRVVGFFFFAKKRVLERPIVRGDVDG
jgi:hypothetical protein